MKTFTARLTQDDELLYEDFKVFLEEATEPSGLRSWYGAFQLPPHAHLEPGEFYWLKLDDGRSGKVLIRNITISFHAPVQVSFVGSGPLSSEHGH